MAHSLKFNNKKAINFYQNYYDIELLNNNTKNNITSMHTIGYPIFYREVNYFWLSGKHLKVANKKYKLNEIIKIQAAVDKSHFVLTIPLQIPYLFFL
jgi:hypothetical protein